jgi:hypothetical protein
MHGGPAAKAEESVGRIAPFSTHSRPEAGRFRPGFGQHGFVNVQPEDRQLRDLGQHDVQVSLAATDVQAPPSLQPAKCGHRSPRQLVQPRSEPRGSARVIALGCGSARWTEACSQQWLASRRAGQLGANSDLDRRAGLRRGQQRRYQSGEAYDNTFSGPVHLGNSPSHGDRQLLGSEHRDTLEYLVRRLEGLGFTGQVARIHGGLHYTDRQEQVQLFRKPMAEGGAPFLVATDAGGEGINLQFCRVMINYGVPWNPARLEQRMGRIHRYGQKHDPVIILNLVAAKTREGRVLKTLLDKLEKIRKQLNAEKWDQSPLIGANVFLAAGEPPHLDADARRGDHGPQGQGRLSGALCHRAVGRRRCDSHCHVLIGSELDLNGKSEMVWLSSRTRFFNRVNMFGINALELPPAVSRSNGCPFNALCGRRPE